MKVEKSFSAQLLKEDLKAIFYVMPVERKDGTEPAISVCSNKHIQDVLSRGRVHFISPHFIP